MFVNYNNSVMEIKCHHYQFMKENVSLWAVKNFSEISLRRAMLDEFTRSKAWERNSCARDLLCFVLGGNLCWSEGSKIDKGKKLRKSFLEKSSLSLIPKYRRVCTPLIQGSGLCVPHCAVIGYSLPALGVGGGWWWVNPQTPQGEGPPTAQFPVAASPKCCDTRRSWRDGPLNQ